MPWIPAFAGMTSEESWLFVRYPLPRKCRSLLARASATRAQQQERIAMSEDAAKPSGPDLAPALRSTT